MVCQAYVQCQEYNREQGRHSSGLHEACGMVQKMDFEWVVIHGMSLMKGEAGRQWLLSQENEAISGSGGSRGLRMGRNQPSKELEDKCFRQRDQHLQSDWTARVRRINPQ